MAAKQLSWADELDLLTRFHPGNVAFSELGMMVEVGRGDDVQADMKEDIEKGGEDYKPAHNTNKQTNMKNIGRGRKISHYHQDDDSFIAQQIEKTLGSGHKAESIFNSSQTSTKTERSLEEIKTQLKSSSSLTPIQKKNALYPGTSGQSSGQEHSSQGGGQCKQTPLPVDGGLACQGESCPSPEHGPIVVRAKLVKKNSTGVDVETSMTKELKNLGIGRGKSSSTDVKLPVGAAVSMITRNSEKKLSKPFQKENNNNNYFPTFDYEGYKKMTKASHWWAGNTSSGFVGKLSTQKAEKKREEDVVERELV